MLGKIELLSILVNLALLVFILFLVRTKRLRLRYSIIWLLTILVLLLFSCFRYLLDKISFFVGIHYPPTFLFLVAFLFLLVIVLHYSVEISRLSNTNNGLIQKLSITNYKLEELEKKIARLNK